MAEFALTTIQFQKLGGLKLKLVTIDQQIDLFAGAYALQRYENGFKPNSIKTDQCIIVSLYRFCELNGIDLVRRVADQDFLKIGEIEGLSSFCGYSQITGDRVSPAWYSARMRGIKAFINYLWLFYQDRSKRDLESLKASQLLYERMQKGFRLYAKAPYDHNRKDKIGLTPELQSKFIAIIDPSEANGLNPWKTNKVRWRNYILLMLLMLGGNRKGETLLLKVNHFQLSGSRKYYDLIKVVDASDYPRMEAPSVKTYGRQVELHNDLAEIIEYYIVSIRKQFLNWQSSSYVFISYRDGLPLSIQTPNAIINELNSKYPEFKGLLSPHRLRNTFHDLLNRALNHKFKDESALGRHLLKSPIQEAAGGWARGSKMPERYSRGSIQERVADVQILLQQQVMNPDICTAEAQDK